MNDSVKYITLYKNLFAGIPVFLVNTWMDFIYTGKNFRFIIEQGYRPKEYDLYQTVVIVEDYLTHGNQVRWRFVKILYILAEWRAFNIREEDVIFFEKMYESWDDEFHANLSQVFQYEGILKNGEYIDTAGHCDWDNGLLDGVVEKLRKIIKGYLDFKYEPRKKLRTKKQQ
jgi:hypothetical protein